MTTRDDDKRIIDQITDALGDDYTYRPTQPATHPPTDTPTLPPTS